MQTDKTEFLESNRRFGDIKYFIICDGKSGSMTLASSFRNSIHAHSTGYLWKKEPVLGAARITLREMQDHSREKFGRKPWVIFSVREPIGRTVSAFFQNMKQFVPKEELGNEEFVLAKLSTLFLDLENYHIFDKNVYHDHIDGLDIYAQPFDVEKGYAVYETERLRIMVLKFERIKEWQELIPTLLLPDEQDDFKYVPTNLSERKTNYAVQQVVIQNFKPSPQDIYVKLDRHRLMLTHFYSTEEITNLRLKWTKKSIE